MISVGYFAGSAAPVLMGQLAPRFGLGLLLAGCAPIYALGAALTARAVVMQRHTA